MSWRNAKVEMSVNGSSWTDISGFANSVAVDGGERATSDFFTNDGDTPILTSGKRASLGVTCRVVYTEGGSEVTEIVRVAYEGNSPFYLRWSPKGGGSTTFMFTTSAGVIQRPVYPVGSADSADLVAVEIALKVVTIAKSVVA
jgi:hypothetical protein